MELLALLQRYLVSSRLAVQWCAARIPQTLEQHNMAAFLLLTYADLRVYTECKSDCTLVNMVAKMCLRVTFTWDVVGVITFMYLSAW